MRQNQSILNKESTVNKQPLERQSFIRRTDIFNVYSVIHSLVSYALLYWFDIKMCVKIYKIKSIKIFFRFYFTLSMFIITMLNYNNIHINRIILMVFSYIFYIYVFILNQFTKGQ
jgi:hypothetical protein